MLAWRITKSPVLRQPMCPKGHGGQHGNGKGCLNLQGTEEKGQAGLGDQGDTHKEPSVPQIIHREHITSVTLGGREGQA